MPGQSPQRARSMPRYRLPTVLVCRAVTLISAMAARRARAQGRIANVRLAAGAVRCRGAVASL